MKPIRKVLFLVVGSWFCGTLLAGETIPDRVCFNCHNQEALKAKFEDGSELSMFIDQERYSRSVHGLKGEGCVACHTDVDIEEHPERELKDLKNYRVSMAGRCTHCHKDAVAKFADDIHSSSSVLCNDCHQPHYGGSPSQARADTSRMCAGCHAEVGQAYSQSAHGAGLLGEANPDVPGCVDCHSPHAIEDTSTVAFHYRSVDFCKRCHGDEEKMNKYGLSTAVMQTYLQDFHGVSVSYSRKEKGAEGNLKATCVDCHGAHAIPRRNTPASLAIKANLVQACRKCHPEATEGFSGAWLSHYIPSPSRAPMVFAVKTFYWLFIPFVILGLIALVALDLVHLFRSKEYRHPVDEGPSHVRFSRYRRGEHVLIIITFTLLLLTGFPQKFNDQTWAEWIILAFGGMDNVRLIHRIVAIVFTVQAVGHVLLNILWLLRGRIHGDMLAEKKDFSDAIGSVKVALGLTAERPRFGRYDFRQKFEYWGMLMGGLVMIVTGFILLYPVVFATFLPGQIIAAAKVAHSFEAVMAMLVIMVWHLYCGLLRPGTFPLDTSIFTGRISHHKMLEEHPLELERRGIAEDGSGPVPAVAESLERAASRGPKSAGSKVSSERLKAVAEDLDK